MKKNGKQQHRHQQVPGFAAHRKRNYILSSHKNTSKSFPPSIPIAGGNPRMGFGSLIFSPLITPFSHLSPPLVSFLLSFFFTAIGRASSGHRWHNFCFLPPGFLFLLSLGSGGIVPDAHAHRWKRSNDQGFCFACPSYSE